MSISNAFDIFKEEHINDHKTLLFLDPPYVDRPITYKDERVFDKEKYLKDIKLLRSKIIYTDTYNKDVDEFLNWRIIDIRYMKNTRPGSKNEYTKKEVAYINF